MFRAETKYEVASLKSAQGEKTVTTSVVRLSEAKILNHVYLSTCEPLVCLVRASELYSEIIFGSECFHSRRLIKTEEIRLV